MGTAPAQTNYARVEAATRTAIRTDLAPSQTVTATTSAAATRLDPVRTTLAQQALTRQVVFDSQSREVLYRAIDVRSAKIARQMPEEAARKLKAYRRAASEPSDESCSFEKTA